jgi:hypothetical protein
MHKLEVTSRLSRRSSFYNCENNWKTINKSISQNRQSVTNRSLDHGAANNLVVCDETKRKSMKMQRNREVLPPQIIKNAPYIRNSLDNNHLSRKRLTVITRSSMPEENKKDSELQKIEQFYLEMDKFLVDTDKI